MTYDVKKPFMCNINCKFMHIPHIRNHEINIAHLSEVVILQCFHVIMKTVCYHISKRMHCHLIRTLFFRIK